MRDKRFTYEVPEKKSHNGTVERILEALEEIGDMTCLELARHLNVKRDNISALLCTLRKPSPRKPQRVHIHSWTYDDEHTTKPYPRPVYRIGKGTNATRPKAKTAAEKQKAQRDTMRARNRCTSVFNLAAGYKPTSLKHKAES